MIIYLKVKLEINSENKSEVLDVLENMDYDFTDKHDRITNTDIQEWTDKDGEVIDDDN